jgi:hypothetical protein
MESMDTRLVYAAASVNQMADALVAMIARSRRREVGFCRSCEEGIDCAGCDGLNSIDVRFWGNIKSRRA